MYSRFSFFNVGSWCAHNRSRRNSATHKNGAGLIPHVIPKTRITATRQFHEQNNASKITTPCITKTIITNKYTKALFNKTKRKHSLFLLRHSLLQKLKNKAMRNQATGIQKKNGILTISIPFKGNLRQSQ